MPEEIIEANVFRYKRPEFKDVVQFTVVSEDEVVQVVRVPMDKIEELLQGYPRQLHPRYGGVARRRYGGVARRKA